MKIHIRYFNLRPVNLNEYERVSCLNQWSHAHFSMGIVNPAETFFIFSALKSEMFLSTNRAKLDIFVTWHIRKITPSKDTAGLENIRILGLWFLSPHLKLLMLQKCLKLISVGYYSLTFTIWHLRTIHDMHDWKRVIYRYLISFRERPFDIYGQKKDCFQYFVEKKVCFWPVIYNKSCILW